MDAEHWQMYYQHCPGIDASEQACKGRFCAVSGGVERGDWDGELGRGGPDCLGQGSVHGSEGGPNKPEGDRKGLGGVGDCDAALHMLRGPPGRHGDRTVATHQCDVGAQACMGQLWLNFAVKSSSTLIALSLGHVFSHRPAPIPPGIWWVENYALAWQYEPVTSKRGGAFTLPLLWTRPRIVNPIRLPHPGIL